MDLNPGDLDFPPGDRKNWVPNKIWEDANRPPVHHFSFPGEFNNGLFGSTKSAESQCQREALVQSHRHCQLLPEKVVVPNKNSKQRQTWVAPRAKAKSPMEKQGLHTPAGVEIRTVVWL